ncbi:MAG: hypothetical protein H6684_07855 [Deltaproteobacteria bacterium]|nr:hypothetical protein [Deltaproteobacteria bacterium]
MDYKALAHDMLDTGRVPDGLGLTKQASRDLAAVREAGFDTAAVLEACATSPHPAQALNCLSHLVDHDHAAKLFTPDTLPRLATLAAASRWALDGAIAHLDLVFTMPPTHVIAERLREASSFVAAGEILGAKIETAAEWRGLLQARAALFDLTDEGDWWDALAGYSEVADVVASLALAELRHEFYGDKNGEHADDFVVLGMGKLGGHELNASSDLDLIYIFDHEDDTAIDGRSRREWFGEIARRLTEELGTSGAGFRVDMRLRPGGSAGPLTCSLAMAESHYEYRGAAWERQMLIRTRAIAGSQALGDEFRQTIRPFVYRRRMDAAALGEIRRVKARLDAEVAVAAGGDENVKLSRGGIRELEYVVQTYQLLYGGRIPELQTPSMREALAVLARNELLPTEDVAILHDAYEFFRRLENRIQLYDGRQNHRLPPPGPVRDGLARSMGYADVDKMLRTYADHQLRVLRIFEALFDSGAGAESSEQAAATPRPTAAPGGVYFSESLRATTEATFASHGFPDAPAAFEIFRRIAKAPESQEIKGFTERLETLAPKLAELAAAQPDPVGALSYFERFILRQNAMTTLMGSLIDDAQMARVMMQLLGRGSYLAEILLSHPEAFVPLFVAQDVSGGPEAVRQAIVEAAWGDVPAIWLAELRRQKTILELQIALEEIYHDDDPETAWALAGGLAAGVLEALGRGLEYERRVPKEGLGILLMGSAGNGEPVLNSDLDLVFLHDDDEHKADLGKVAQRILKELEGTHPEGFLYRTDLRLRPFGNQGTLLPSLTSAFNFYRDKSPVTTRLALLRTRAVYGAPAFAFADQLAETILAKGLPADEKDELSRIREKVVAEVPAGRVDAKSSPGALADLEFFIGGAQLEHGYEIPALRARNNRQALSAMVDAGLLEREQADVLDGALRFFKRLESRLRTLFPRPVSLLPDSAADLAILARMTHFETPEAMLEAFHGHRRNVLTILKLQ